MFEGEYPPGVTGNEPELNGIDEMWIPDDCCRYCTHYDGDVCTKLWNNMDESYYCPDTDDKEETDCCADYEWNEELLELPKEPKKPTRRENEKNWQWQIRLRAYFAEHDRWSRAYWKAVEYRDRDFYGD